MTTIGFTHSVRDEIAGALQFLENDLHSVGQSLGKLPAALPEPSDLVAYRDRVVLLKNEIANASSGDSWQRDFLPDPLLRTALARARRNRADQIQKTQQLLLRGKDSDALNVSLNILNGLLSSDAFCSVEPERCPRLADYVSLHGRKLISKSAPELLSEERDPKHQILLSSALLEGDLQIIREQCEDRQRHLAVVFADLDNFKNFNDKMGEVQVDRLVLPTILNTVESSVYGHGRAYRHGGDEFVLLLPNADVDVAVSIVNQMKKMVEDLKIENVSLPIHLSVGVWITVPESHLTNNELVERASHAKKRAKELGKKRIVVHRERGSKYNEQVIE